MGGLIIHGLFFLKHDLRRACLGIPGTDLKQIHTINHILPIQRHCPDTARLVNCKVANRFLPVVAGLFFLVKQGSFKAIGRDAPGPHRHRKWIVGGLDGQEQGRWDTERCIEVLLYKTVGPLAG